MEVSFIINPLHNVREGTGRGGTSAANVHYFRSDIFLTTLFLTLGETIKTASEFHALYFTLSWYSEDVLPTKLCVSNYKRLLSQHFEAVLAAHHHQSDITL